MARLAARRCRRSRPAPRRGPGMSSSASSPPSRSGTSTSQACSLLPSASVVSVAVMTFRPTASGPAKAVAPSESCSGRQRSAERPRRDRRPRAGPRAATSASSTSGAARIQVSSGASVRQRRLRAGRVGPEDASEGALEPHGWGAGAGWVRTGLGRQRGRAREGHDQAQRRARSSDDAIGASIASPSLSRSASGCSAGPRSPGSGTTALNSQVAAGAMVSS